MNKITWFFFFVVAVVFGSLESCQSSRSSTATRMLKFNLESGKGYDYELIMNLDQEIMNQTVQMDMATYYSMDVAPGENDMKIISSRVDRFKIKTSVAGFNLEVDTDKPVSSSDNDTSELSKPIRMVSKLFGAIKGKKFSMQVDPEGKVVEVSGFENMAESIVDSMGVEGSEREEMKVQFQKQFNGDQIKEQMERFWYIFPNKEVKVGDSWQKNSLQSGNLPGQYNSTYTVREIEGDMVTLSEHTLIDSDNNKMKLKGDITGTIIVDSRWGLVVSANQDMKLKASAEGMSFEIKGKTRLKGKAR